jgi:hypothetical protein
MFNPLKPTVLAIAAFCLYGVNAHADTFREVRCANGKTVQASGTQSNRQACLLIASQPVQGSSSRLGSGSLTAAGNAQQTALLLPAVQRVREAPSRLAGK